MFTMVRFSLRVVGVLTISLLIAMLAGCGSGSSKGNSGGGTPTPTLVSIKVGPPNANVKVGNSGAFTATGTFSDGKLKDLTSTAVWTTDAPSVAAVDTTGMVTGLNGGAANITATSGAISGSNALAVVPPILINVAPAANAVTLGGKLAFAASAKFADGTIQDLTHFVNWSSSLVAATIDANGLATGVSRGVTTISASNSSVTGSTILNVTDKNFSDANLSGPYAFTLTESDSRGSAFESGSITADGKGTITGGAEDLNTVSGVSNVALTGSYVVYPDGRGVLILTANDVSRTFRFVLKANSATVNDTSGELIQDDTQGNALGALEPQDASAFNNPAMGNSSFVFRVGGYHIDATHDTSRMGLFTADATGTIMTGSDDISDAGTMISNSSIGGTMGTVDTATGRATGTLDGANYVYYVVSANKINIIDIDAADPMAGVAEKQTNPALNADGGYVLLLERDGTRGRFWIIGQFDLSGSSVVDGVQNQDSGVVLTATGGTVTIAANGRGTIHEMTDHGGRDFIVYVLSEEKMYVLQSNDPRASSGTAELQHPGPSSTFGVDSLNGDFMFSAAETGESNLTFLGQMVFLGDGNTFGIEDTSQPGSITNVAVNGTYAVGANGVSTVDISSSGAGVTQMTLYLVSPSKGYFWGSSSPDVNGSFELQ
jgi:Big-like domain-containing protein